MASVIAASHGRRTPVKYSGSCGRLPPQRDDPRGPLLAQGGHCRRAGRQSPRMSATPLKEVDVALIMKNLPDAGKGGEVSKVRGLPGDHAQFEHGVFGAVEADQQGVRQRF